jgi:hypothetical protein
MVIKNDRDPEAVELRDAVRVINWLAAVHDLRLKVSRVGGRDYLEIRAPITMRASPPDIGACDEPGTEL